MNVEILAEGDFKWELISICLSAIGLIGTGIGMWIRQERIVSGIVERRKLDEKRELAWEKRAEIDRQALWEAVSDLRKELSECGQRATKAETNIEALFRDAARQHRGNS